MKRVAKHQRSAGLGRRKREAEGRLAPEMAESYEARSQTPAKRRGWPQTCGEAGRKALFAGNSGQVWVFRQTDTGGVHLEPAGVLFIKDIFRNAPPEKAVRSFPGRRAGAQK